MEKRILKDFKNKLAALLALVMVLSVGLPVGVLASPSQITHNLYFDKNSPNKDKLASEGWAWYSNGATIDGTSYDGSVLLLNGINMNYTYGVDVYNNSDERHALELPADSTIVLLGGSANRIVINGTINSQSDVLNGIDASVPSDYIGSNREIPLTICGDGTLEVKVLADSPTYASASRGFHSHYYPDDTHITTLVIKDVTVSFDGLLETENDIHDNGNWGTSPDFLRIIDSGKLITRGGDFAFICSSDTSSFNLSIIGSENFDGSNKSSGWEAWGGTYGKGEMYAKYLELTSAGTPAISTVSASPSTLSSNGGNSTITVTGVNLTSSLQVKAVDANGNDVGISASSTTGSETSRTATLTFPTNPSHIESKTYTVKASTDGGTTWTGNATVTVQHNTSDVITITQHPQSATYRQYETPAPLTVSASALGGGDISYEWYKNTANSNSGGTLVGTGTDFVATTTDIGTFYYYATATVEKESTLFTAKSNVATFKVTDGSLYNLTVKSGDGGTITSDVDGTYAEGESINISAKANSGYVFNGWSSSGGGTFSNQKSVETTFTMPANDAEVTASFRKSSGGGGGGGGGGGLSNKPVDTTKTDDVDLSLTSEKDGDKVTAIIDSKEAAELIKDAKEHGEVVLNPQGATGAKEVEVVIPKETVSELAKDTKADIQLNAGDGMRVTIPHSELSKVSGDMHITATKGDNNQYSVSVKGGNNNAAVTALVSFQNTGGNVAYTVDANGNKTPIRLSSVDGNRVYARVTTPATIVIEKHENLFSDMVNHPMSADADFVANRELFVGKGAGVFDPNGNMTMGMMATVLHRLAGEPAAATTGGEWYASGMQWASNGGYISESNASKTITRLDLATTLYRYAKSIGLDTTASSDSTMPFSDTSHLTGEAKDAMQWAVDTGILQGYGNGTVGADNECTRIQVAAMYERFIQAVVK